MQLIPVIREIQRRAARSSEDADAIGGLQGAVPVALGGIAHLGQVAELQMHIVEDVRLKALGHGGGRVLSSGFPGRFARSGGYVSSRRAWFLNGEVADGLRLSFIEDLEILFAEVAN